MKKFKRQWWLLPMTVIVAILGIAGVLWLKEGYLVYNAFPVDYEFMKEEEWANMYFYIYLSLGIGLSIVYSLGIVRGMWCNWFKGRTKVAWVVQLILSIVCSFIAPLVMGIKYPEDSFCYITMWIINPITYAVMFLATSWASPKIWDYLPWE